MLRMTFELLPYGSERDKKTIKIIEIANTMTHEQPYKFGNYKVRVKNALHKDTSWLYMYITDFPREQYDAMYLLYLVIRKYIHESQRPIDKRAEEDKDASMGCGHSVVPGSRKTLGRNGKGDRSGAGNISIYIRHIRSLKNKAVSIWEQELQKNDLP